ncbi:MAG: condensation domain-containing protein [Kofleriaceae bacterium]
MLALLKARTVRRVAELLAAAPRAIPTLELPALARRDVQAAHPLTSSQRMAWELTHRRRQSLFEVPRRVVELVGPLDALALHRAAELVMIRHTALRATFVPSAHGLVQAIETSPRVEWHEHEAITPRELAALLEQPFDLEAGPLIRFVLSRTGADHHVFGFSVHHIVFDGGSMPAFVGDLALAYRAVSAGTVPAWSPAYELADFAAWEQQVSHQHGATMAAYWRDQLAGAHPPALPLSDWTGELDFAPEPAITHRLELTCLDRLGRTAAATGSTPFLVALTSFGMTLRALLGSDEVCVASPYMRRDVEGAAGIVGYLAHPLVFRLGHTEDLASAIMQTTEHVLGAYRHGHVPLMFGPDVFPGLPSSDALAGEQLYRIFFNYQRASSITFELGDAVSVKPVDLGPESESRFPLMLFVVETPRALIYNLVAQTRCYTPERLAALATHFTADLERTISRGGVDVANL